ncbi:hypothetical protein DSECCO2_474810 [anaerobic digester metagenome]
MLESIGPQVFLDLFLHALGLHEHEKNQAQGGVVFHGAVTQVLELLVGHGLEEAVGELADPFGIELRHEVRDEAGQTVGGLLGDVGHGHQEVFRQGFAAALLGVRELVENDQEDMGPQLGLGQGHVSSYTPNGSRQRGFSATAAMTMRAQASASEPA